MNIQDYFEQEAKEKWTFSKVHPENTVKDFNSGWNTLIILLLASRNDHLLTFVPSNVHEMKRLL